jgi:DNA-binding FadR family transcriptional regulator
MNVTNVSSATCTCQSYAAGFKQRIQDFKSLNDALQSGDLTAAQTAFAAFQKDVQNSPQASRNSQLSDQNTQAAKDLQALQDALKSGDMSAAQQAFASLKQDLKAGHAHHGHHHRKVDNKNDGDADDNVQGSDSSSTATDSDTAPSTAASSATLDAQA